MFIILKRSGGAIQTNMHRKYFIGQLAGLTGISILMNACKQNSNQWQLSITGANATLGHTLRKQQPIPAPAETRYTEVVIIGAGISGLSAARSLYQQGVKNIKLLELENTIGGNAKSGSNEISAYPCGAHYVPIPNNELKEYLDFLKEADVIIGYNEAGYPIYNELFLCFDPEERLFINGTWQEGLVPNFGVPEAEVKEIKKFLQQMDFFRHAKGTDGKDAFAIPVDASSKDPAFAGLDQMTMEQWLQQNAYTSKYLISYINYCCKDDYGTDIYTVSAWAGIHYFASRKGKAANADHADVLTWPEGNGYLAAQLAKDVATCIQTGCLVNSIQPKGEQLFIDYYDTNTGKQMRYICEHCILAVPQYIAALLLNDTARKSIVKQNLKYVPWLVANLQVKNMTELNGIGTCWDNVLHNGVGLGYVDATHQLTRQHHTHKNFTYYLPITDHAPEEARKKAGTKTKEEWQQIILQDMKKVYPEIEQSLEAISITIWGHAMAQPLPGLISGQIRQNLKQSGYRNIHFAHTDLAGISIFEEAFYQGIHAATEIVKNKGIRQSYE